MDQTKPITMHVDVKFQNTVDRGIPNLSFGGREIIYLRSGMRMAFNFSIAKLKAASQRKTVFKILESYL